MEKRGQETDAYGRIKKSVYATPWKSTPNKQLRRKFYDDFFAGYSFRKVPRSNGCGTKIIREYSGNLYKQQVSQKQALFLRIGYAVLFLTSVFLWLYALMLNTESNRCWYVMVVGFCAAIGFGRLMLSLFSYIWSGQKLTQYEYQNGAVPIPGRCRTTIWILLISAVIPVLMFVFQNWTHGTLELFRFGMLLASAAILKVLARIENNVHYLEIPAKGLNKEACTVSDSD